MRKKIIKLIILIETMMISRIDIRRKKKVERVAKLIETYLELSKKEKDDND